MALLIHNTSQFNDPNIRLTIDPCMGADNIMWESKSLPGVAHRLNLADLEMWMESLLPGFDT